MAIKTGATQYHAHLSLQVKGCAIEGLDIYNNRDLRPLNLLNGLLNLRYDPFISEEGSSDNKIVEDISTPPPSFILVLLLDYDDDAPQNLIYLIVQRPP